MSAYQQEKSESDTYLQIVGVGRNERADSDKYDLSEERYEHLPVGCTLISEPNIKQSILFDHFHVREIRFFAPYLIVKMDIE